MGFCSGAPALFVALLIACSSDSGTARAPKGPVGGTIVVSSSADADVLLPPLTMTLLGKQVVDQIFDNLADIGPALNTVGDAGFTPRLSDRWTVQALDVPSFHINSRHDGTMELGHRDDVRYTFHGEDTALASPLASNLDNVDSFRRDSFTARCGSTTAPRCVRQSCESRRHLPRISQEMAPATLRESTLSGRRLERKIPIRGWIALPHVPIRHGITGAAKPIAFSARSATTSGCPQVPRWKRDSSISGAGAGVSGNPRAGVRVSPKPRSGTFFQPSQRPHLRPLSDFRGP